MDGLPYARCPDSTVLLRRCSAVPLGAFAPCVIGPPNNARRRQSDRMVAPGVDDPLAAAGMVGEKVIDKRLRGRARWDCCNESSMT